MSGAHGRSPASISFRVDPAPPRGIEWLELGGQEGTTARLLPSPRAAVRLGPLTPVTASPPTGQRSDHGLPPGGDAPREAADRADGPRHHLDLGIALPPIDGMILQLDSLISAPGAGRCSCAPVPGGGATGTTGAASGAGWRSAPKTTGGSPYQYSFGGSAGRDGHEELSLRFRPRLDPLARRLRLTCAGSAEQMAVDLDLAD